MIRANRGLTLAMLLGLAAPFSLAGCNEEQKEKAVDIEKKAAVVAKKTGDVIKEDAKKVGEAVKEGAHKAGEMAGKAGEVIKEDAKKVGEVIKEDAKKVGDAIKGTPK